MKSKTKALFLITLLTIFLFSSIFNSRFSKNIIINNNYFDQVQINQSGFWDLTGSPILIDDYNLSNNWAYTASHYAWCSGSGTWADPYVIENVTINGQGSSNCIEIWNSNAYFIVRNCSLYNSGSFPANAGIKLYYVDNGKIINNNCSDNNFYGIHLDYSINSTISGNNASNNNLYGIVLCNSHDSTLSGNNASNNNYIGMILDESNNNTLSGNNANNNDWYGIYLGDSDNNILSGNTASNNDEGIYLHYHCDNNTLSGNTADNNFYDGIFLDWHSNNNTLSENIVCNNTRMGIHLCYSNINTLSGNTISNNSYGMKLDSNSNNSKIFLNYFVNNEIDAEDNGINNKWDNGTIGNYWDDYAGVDANDDGIGDTPYIISGTAGSQDNFPIWTDGDETIISFGNCYILFMFITITILSFIILEKLKKK